MESSCRERSFAHGFCTPRREDATGGHRPGCPRRKRSADPNRSWRSLLPGQDGSCRRGHRHWINTDLANELATWPNVSGCRWWPTLTVGAQPAFADADAARCLRPPMALRWSECAVTSTHRQCTWRYDLLMLGDGEQHFSAAAAGTAQRASPKIAPGFRTPRSTSPAR